MADQRFVTGFIAKDGSKLSSHGDYTIVPSGNGIYNVVFHPPFAVLPVVVATQVFPNEVSSSGGSTRDNAVVVGVTERQFRVKVGDGEGRGTNRDWTFIAVGIGLSGAALEEWEAEEKARKEAGDAS
jgi:hypothetical protein